MERRATEQLLRWKEAPARKPLLLMGARQVGKTWLMREFGRRHYRNTAYLRFDNNSSLRAAFEGDFDPERMLRVIQLESGESITPGETLIIFDEIQECPAALTALKYFCEEAREQHIIAAGSLLGVYDHRGTGFPVGKVDMMTLYPMTFGEFLRACGNGRFAEVLDDRDWETVKIYAERYREWLRYYYFVGGMPEAVATYADGGDFAQVRQVQENLLTAYQRDFSKHAPKEITPRISLIWDSMPAQLARENKRFMCSEVQRGFRSRDLECAMQWLTDAGLVTHVRRISKPALPAEAYAEAAFKAYFADVGLLAAKSGLNARVILEGNRIFQEFKGALTEQYVMQELRAAFGKAPFYWVNGNNRSEVDFLLPSDMELIPIEVKAELNLRAKSLGVYCQKFRPRWAVRTSMANFHTQILPFENGGGSYTQLDIPLYAISQLAACCSELP